MLTWSSLDEEDCPTRSCRDEEECMAQADTVLPCREQILARKRREYRDMVPEYYDIANNDRSEEEMGALRQVSVDVPRTAPGVAFFHEAPVQKCLERILYIWGIR